MIPAEIEENGILVLLTSSSRTFESVKEFSKILKKPCRFFLSLDENIRSALEKFYHFDGLVKKFSSKTDLDYFIEGNFFDWDVFEREIPQEILEVLKTDCKIVLTDPESFSDALNELYDFKESFPEPSDEWN